MVSGNRRGIRIIGFVVVSACISGCSYLKVTRYSKETFPPTQSVEVFHKFPDRPYNEIGRLSIRNAPFRDEEGTLIKEAEKLGADGVVFLTENAGVPVTDQVAVAIKWKGEK